MFLIPLLVAASTATDVWVAAAGCDTNRLVSALQVLRPHLHIHAGSAPPGGLQATLGQSGGSFDLTLRGRSLDMSRVFEEAGGCEAGIRTGALIIDGALDDLSLRSDAPQIDRLAPFPVEIALALGGSVMQGDLEATGGPEVELRFGRGPLVWGVSGDFRPPQLSSAGIEPGGGRIRLTGGDVEASIGFAPRVGRGRLAIEAAGGLDVVSGALVQYSLVSGAPYLFHFGTQVSELALAAIRAGYTLHLSRHFFLTARVEERFVPQRMTFAVDGAVGGPEAEVRQWVLAGTVAVGWRFR